MTSDIRAVSVSDSEVTTGDDAAIHNAAELSSMTKNFAPTQTNHRIPWIGAMPHPRTAVMAVVDDDGYLIPLCTSADLLRAFKTIWRVTED
jgi:hypothetical protein